MTTIEAVHPATGEILEHLDQQPAEKLADTLDEIYRQQGELARWESAIAAELRQRLKVRQTKRATFGDWEIEATTSRSAEWDAAELEAELAGLIDQGIVRAGDVAEIVTRPPVVSKSKAGRLVSTLTGDARDRVAALRTWKEKPGKLTVARSVDLLDAAAAPPATEKTPPMGGQADHDGSALLVDTVSAGSSESPGEGERAPSDSGMPAGPAVNALDPMELFA